MYRSNCVSFFLSENTTVLLLVELNCSDKWVNPVLTPSFLPSFLNGVLVSVSVAVKRHL